MGDHDCYVTAQVLLSDPHIVLDPPFDYLEFEPKTAKKKKKEKIRDRGCFLTLFPHYFSSKEHARLSVIVSTSSISTNF